MQYPKLYGFTTISTKERCVVCAGENANASANWKSSEDSPIRRVYYHTRCRGALNIDLFEACMKLDGTLGKLIPHGGK